MNNQRASSIYFSLSIFAIVLLGMPIAKAAKVIVNSPNAKVALSNSQPGNYPVQRNIIYFGQLSGAGFLPAEIYFNDERNVEVISDYASNRFLYKAYGTSTWHSQDFEEETGLATYKPHSIVFSVEDNRYYAADTDNHRIISFPNFDSPSSEIRVIHTFDGISISTLRRPHSMVYSPADGYIYVMFRNGLGRFKGNQGQLSDASLIHKNQYNDVNGANLGIEYTRSLLVEDVDGLGTKLYMVASTRGAVAEVVDFNNPSSWIKHTNQFTISKNNYGNGTGIWDETGLVLNDIEYFNGYWYGSNHFTNIDGTKTASEIRKNKLIRWKTWTDFYNSKWDDLSYLVGEGNGGVYNFTEKDGELYLGFTSGETPGISKIVELQ